MLEIGCSERSLTTWRNCFPLAAIVGLDISPRGPTNQEDLGSVEGVTFIEGDQRDVELLRSLGVFDVVIDDGGHIPHEQLLTFRTLFLAMPVGGWYFIEDLHTSYDGYDGGSTIDFLKFVLDDMHARYQQLEQRWPIGEMRVVDSLVGFRKA